MKQKIKNNIYSIRTRVPEKLLLVINFIAAVALILSVMASTVSPAKLWFLALLGLAYIPLLLINILFIFFWIFLLRKWVIGSFLAVLVSWGNIGTHFRFRNSELDIQSPDTVKIMSFNVRLFDLYQWKSDKKYKTRSRIFRMIKEQKPDLLCFQEYYSNPSKGFNVRDTLNQNQDLKYNFVANFKSLEGLKEWGMAIYSRFPMFNKQRVPFTNSLNSYFQYADIAKNGDTIRVFNIHFESIHFGQEDYLFINDIGNQYSGKENFIENGQRLFLKIGNAFSRRAEQVETVRRYVASSPYPVILCGDFNDTPASYVYNRMTSELKDSFCECGSGLSGTYPNLFFPIRIDFILHSFKAFTAFRYNVINEDLSDHL
ncbi:MAG: endonuclease/exonuclease/phosphatase family protein, partial [Bacteroidota bacterium]|nr:endonuclease/exonuclease/phosphatase family protein [Bacteroidota bacterium]